MKYDLLEMKLRQEKLKMSSTTVSREKTNFGRKLFESDKLVFKHTKMFLPNLDVAHTLDPPIFPQSSTEEKTRKVPTKSGELTLGQTMQVAGAEQQTQLPAQAAPGADAASVLRDVAPPVSKR